MVVALLALSLVMILGGAAAVVQGFPYVRLESGLAMVIGGSTAASAGVILLGLSAVVDRLRRVQRAIIRLREEGFGQQAAVPVDSAPWLAPSGDPVMPAPAVEPPSAGTLAGTAGLAGLSLGAIRPGGRGTEPVFEDPDLVAERRTEAEPLLPDLLPEAPARRKREEDHLFAAEPAPAAPPEPMLPVAEGIGLRPALDLPTEPPAPVPEPAPEPAPAVAEAETRDEDNAPEPEPARHAVGSYASGANTYVMFSDGSIEADTPRGRFTFGSLDELKSFVNAGGEETRGAA
ncbi:hypothetical protein ASG52_07970 [Methylobacterium sp. Leaf456]|uniref:hypothetical protein n=1 Tax=Methylobacterium sp. Leaf456 TaxID=1736382 RepID=UPI0006F2D479|nr:hypothetical protein [Methylobacterium sp. Leaf456]KQT50004.1 hypothetical protein ASG52_07970 [Methylobacterium sp. Leaf456]